MLQTECQYLFYSLHEDPRLYEEVYVYCIQEGEISYYVRFDVVNDEVTVKNGKNI